LNVDLSGLAVELAIEDPDLADRSRCLAGSQSCLEAGSDTASIVLTDALPEARTDQELKSADSTEVRIALEAVAKGLAVAPLSLI
jgi:hypothetical protein